MSTFTQWVHKEKVKRFTWLCGKEEILKFEAIAFIQKTINASTLNSRWFDMCDCSSEEVWNWIKQYSLDDRNRLVLIYNANRIMDWKPLHDLFFNGIDNKCYVLFVSDEVPNKTKSPLDILAPRRAYFDLVVCNSLSTDAPKDRRGDPTRKSDFVQWIQSQIMMTDTDAQLLIERSGASLPRCKDAINKAKILGSRFPRSAINILCESSAEDFEYHLIANEKYKALHAIQFLDLESFSKAIGHLDHMLDVLEKLHIANRASQSVGDVVSSEDIPGFVVKLYWQHSRNYDKAKIAHCRQVLTELDDQISVVAYVPDFAQVLVALW